MPFTLTSFVLSLLLVFLTNSAYARWWEARIFWGRITQLTRDIMRETLSFAGMDDGPLIDMVRCHSPLTQKGRFGVHAPRQLLDVCLPGLVCPGYRSTRGYLAIACEEGVREQRLMRGGCRWGGGRSRCRTC